MGGDSAQRVPAAEEPRGIRPPDGRLPDATRLGRVRLQVADLARSLAYYTEAIGLRVLAHEGARAVLGAHGDDAPLVELEARPGAAPVPRRGRLGLYHFAILLPDRAALGRFVAHLAERGERAGASDHAVSEALYLTDPDGLGIEVYADRPRAEWRYRGPELTMTTEPLDVAKVVRAASGEAWAGMPAGTTIGHVHLHVGDLPAASDFYHAALGFDRVVWSYPGALFLSAGGYHHHIGVNTWAGAGATPPGADDARLLAWELVLPRRADVDAAAERLARAGYDVTEGEGGWLAADPWRTRLRLSAAEIEAR